MILDAIENNKEKKNSFAGVLKRGHPWSWLPFDNAVVRVVGVAEGGID